MIKVRPTLLALAIVAVACMCAKAQNEKISSIGSPITKEKAKSWIENFKAKYANTNYGHTYGEKMFREIFSTQEVHGLYIFNAMDGEGNIHTIIKPASEKGDLLAAAYQHGWPCPPICWPDGENIASVGSRMEEGLAQQWILNFQKNNPERVFANLYGKDAFNLILSKEHNEGIYFAYGLDEKGIEHLVLLGIKKNGGLNWDLAIQHGIPCPPFCSGGYPVNGVAHKK